MNALELSKQLNSKLTDIFKEDDSDFFKKYFNEAKKKEKETYTESFFSVVNEVIGENFMRAYSKGDYVSFTEYSQREKLTVDLVSWISFNDGSTDKNIKENLWKYETLFEHENDGFTWLDELQKLCSLKCENKLIVTYGRCPQGNSEYFNKDRNVILGNPPQTPDKKGVNLLDHANKIVKETLSHSEQKFIEMAKDDEKFLEVFPNIVVMFGAEVAELENNNKELSAYLYDRYQYNYIQEKFVLIQED
ncbi:hypothetical protein H9L01_00425 [Erysipelothrix inopinata]|uniref:Uncharacterized protein n=1 Tax=Erysipelothrix inopinata TaxID=225084 RepID=A0A7G9RZ53_9FIRM|nr:hypothetical protein [Erysipelothrix inopinata]QNN60878.1 hypothetical protein H9L01_00425 [Erysipelothrix inopinata]